MADFTVQSAAPQIMQGLQAFQEQYAAGQEEADRQSRLDAGASLLSEMNPKAVSEWAMQNPDLVPVFTQAAGLEDAVTEKSRLQTAKDVLTGRVSPREAYQQRVLEIQAAGGDASMIGEFEQGATDEDLIKMAEMDLIMFGGPKMHESYLKSKGKAVTPDIGTYNPRDYTVESFADFVKSGDPSVLERFSEKTIIAGGVPYKLDTATNEYVPLKTAGEIGADKSEIEELVVTAREEAKGDVEKKIKEDGQLKKIEDADRVYKDLAGADLDKIYGRGESLYPDFFRSQEGIDMQAKRDQLVGMLQLGARGELKGQGQITEGEQKILSNSVTILANPNISPEAARSAIDDAMRILYRNAGMEFDLPEREPEFPGAPAVGSVVDGWTYIGGDPAQQSSWSQ